MRFVILSAVFWVVYGYPKFQKQIPNGDKVPNPCSTNQSDIFWAAVGHYHPNSRTERKNPFGSDFRKNKFLWTKSLCMMDSDKDGKTNGQELGDPNCTWKTGSIPSGQATGHPGICEPINSPRCQTKGFSCRCLVDPNSCPNLPGDPR